MKLLFEDCVTGRHIRDGHRATPKDVMYHGRLSLDGIAKMYADQDYDSLFERMIRARKLDTGSCSESCEVLSNQIEFEF